MGCYDNVLNIMKKYIEIYCQSCIFYREASNITGACTLMAGMNIKEVLILDKASIINKIRKSYQPVYNPIIVANTFGCVYHKEK